MLLSKSAKRERSASLPDLPTIDLTQIISKVPLFKNVNEETLSTKIAPRLHLRLYRQGDLIIREGERGKHLFILLSGTASVFSERSECKLSELTSGAVFGEIAVLYDQPRTASVRLSSAVGKVAVLSRSDLEGALASDSGLLKELRERTITHLQSDLVSQKADPVVVAPETVRSSFRELNGKDDDLLRLFLLVAKGYRIQKNQRIPLQFDKVYMLQSGHGKLLGVGKSRSISGGTVYSDSDFDFLLTNTTCILIVAPKGTFQGLQVGKIYDTDSDSEDSVIPVNSTVDWILPGEEEPTRKKVRTAESVDVELLKMDKSCTKLNLTDKWEYKSEELLYICNNFTNLKELVIADWSFKVSTEALKSLQKLSNLKSLSLVNIEAVDDEVIKHLPSSIVNLDVSYCHRINDFGSFARLKSLHSLIMTRCSPKWASAPLPSTITKLVLAECHLMTDSTLSHVIEHLDHLQYLDVSFCESVKNLSVIQSLKQLEYLNLKNLEVLDNVVLKRVLEELKLLKELDVSFNPNLSQLLELVKEHEHLKMVHFDHCPRIDQKQASLLTNLYSSN